MPTLDELLCRCDDDLHCYILRALMATLYFEQLAGSMHTARTSSKQHCQDCLDRISIRSFTWAVAKKNGNMIWTLGFHSSICFSWKQAWVSLMNTPTTQTKILHVHKCRNSYTWSSQKHQAQCSRINQNQFNNQENQEFILYEHKMSQVVAQVCMFRQNGLKSYCTWHGSCCSTVTLHPSLLQHMTATLRSGARVVIFVQELWYVQ